MHTNLTHRVANRSTSRALALLVAAALAGGCAMNETQQRTASGAAIGALGGALIGTSRESAAIGAAVGRPVVRDEDGVRPDGADHQGLERDLAAPGRHGHPVVRPDPEGLRQPGMDLETRLRVLIHQGADPPCLRPRELLADHSPSG